MTDSTSLPVVETDETNIGSSDDQSFHRVIVHSFRVALLFSILLLIRFAHHDTKYAQSDLSSSDAAVTFAREVFPLIESIEKHQAGINGNRLVDNDGSCVGYLMQTSPQSDHVIGYSGPTNCLIALNDRHKIVSVKILNSGDTVDHVEAVVQNQKFFESFVGLGFESHDEWEKIDAVSGATLTSHAVIASIANRVSGKAPSLKFNAKPTVEKLVNLYADAVSVDQVGSSSIWNVIDTHGRECGTVLITTPTADGVNGYQGPTATLAGFDLAGVCVGVVVDQTYDNQPYASYLDTDAPFQNLYVGKTLEQISGMTPEFAEIDGVSGATMTSVCVAEGLAVAAAVALQPDSLSGVNVHSQRIRRWQSYVLDVATVLLVLTGVMFSFSTLTTKRWLRFIYQFLVIIVLGFVSGHMLSQASVAGWSAHAVPWTVAPGLVFLSLAAVAVPIVSRHQPYCHQICPFGAMQQLARNRIGWKLPIPKVVRQFRGTIPFVLLVVTVYVAMTGSTFNLASIEPFDGFSFRVAGWATIAILIAGLMLSFLTPMAYCRFGCPTGAMLNFVRFRSDSHQLGMRDIAATMLLVLAIALL